MRHLPNAITILRLALIPWFGYEVYRGERTMALVLLGVIGFSDFLDGWIARRFEITSALGAILDPAADKLAQMTALLMLMAVTHQVFTPIPGWFVALVFGRDLLLVYGALRIRGRRKTVEIQPRLAGKLSTLLVFVVLFGALFDAGATLMFAALLCATPVVVFAAVHYTLEGRRQLANS